MHMHLEIKCIKASNFFFFWLHWVFFAGWGLPLVAGHRFPLVQSMGSRACRLQRSQCVGLSCPHSMWTLSSPNQGWNTHPLIGRQISNHWTSGEVPLISFWRSKVSSSQNYLGLTEIVWDGTNNLDSIKIDSEEKAQRDRTQTKLL